MSFTLFDSSSSDDAHVLSSAQVSRQALRAAGVPLGTDTNEEATCCCDSLVCEEDDVIDYDDDLTLSDTELACAEVAEDQELDSSEELMLADLVFAPSDKEVA